jgi:tetratricopeptide (TPR) repeat protein
LLVFKLGQAWGSRVQDKIVGMALCGSTFPNWVDFHKISHHMRAMGQPFRSLPTTGLNSILISITPRLPVVQASLAPVLPATFRNGLAIALSALTVAITLPGPALASIPLSSPPPQDQQRRALTQLGVNARSPEQAAIREEEEPVSQKVERVMALMEEASTALEDGDFSTALRCHSEIIARYPDLALAERARIARGLLLYQVGKPQEALLQLEDEEVALRGSAEVHAALAVIFYDLGKPVQAEQQWEVASEFDKRYSDVYWVQKERHWPPKLIQALENFLNLSYSEK